MGIKHTQRGHINRNECCGRRRTQRERRHELIGFTTFSINGRLIERRHANNEIRQGNESKQRSEEHSDSVTRSHWLREHGSASHILPHLINVILRIYKRLAFLYKIRDFLANFLATTSLNLLVNGQIDLSVSSNVVLSWNQLVTGHFPVFGHSWNISHEL